MGVVPTQEEDHCSDAERLHAFCATLWTRYKDEEDLFERQVVRPSSTFTPEPFKDEAATANTPAEADEVDRAILQEFRRPRPEPLLRLDKVHNQEQLQYAAEIEKRQESVTDVNASLGVAQFYVDIVDKVTTDHVKTEEISIVVECHHYDSIDPFSKSIAWTREEIQKTLYMRYVKTFAKVSSALIERLPALQPFFNSNNSVRAIKLSVPRYDALSAMIVALTYTTETKLELLESENVFEVYAIASILGIEELVEQCRVRIRATFTQGSAVLAGYLSARYGDAKLLNSVHTWIQINLLETNKIATLDSDGIISLEKQTLMFRRVRVQSSVFADVVKAKQALCLPYMTPSPTREALKLIRERDPAGGEATYLFVKPDTNTVRLAARYDPIRGEYLISRSRNIGLHDEDYIGGITFNIAGTCFTIFDSASRCTTYSSTALKSFDRPRTELGAVLYVRNFFGWEPREFTIVLPRENKTIMERQGSFMDYFSYDTKDFVHIRNRPPKWNEERATYTLDFRNHVKKASKKNFILETNDNEFKEVMMMGKIERDQFYVHYNEPLSQLVTFGICLSSFHKKRLVK